MNYLKTCMISAAFALSSLAATPAHADLEIDPATDLFKEPLCRAQTNTIRALKIISGQEPTGIKASNDKWDMEIYQNKERGDWTLVGRSKNPEIPQFMLCQLVKHTSNVSYTTQKWYGEHFIKAGPQIAGNTNVPKPSMN